MRYSVLNTTDLNTTVPHLISSCLTTDTEVRDSDVDTVGDTENVMVLDVDASLEVTELGDITNGIRFNIHPKGTNKDS